MFGWFKRDEKPNYTVNELIADFDGDNYRYLVETIVGICPSLLQQFYAQLAFRVHLEDATSPQFAIFDISDEGAYWSIAPGLCFDFDEAIFTEFLKSEFENAIAGFFVRLLRGYVNAFNFTVNGRECEGSRATLELFETGVYSSALQKSGVRLFDYIYELACNKRNEDIAQFKSEVEQRKLKLIPVLNSARRSAYNKYGDFDGSVYYGEIDQFLEYLFSKKDFPFFHNFVAFQSVAYKYFDALLDGIPETNLPPKDGHDFEHWVAAQLVKAGWTASVTQASGDDGVDVIAERDGITVAVQCKRYAGSVGNKAVQEVYAGMKHMQLDRAVVISTGQYTKSAQKLANSTGVFLLSEHDILHMWDILQK